MTPEEFRLLANLYAELTDEIGAAGKQMSELRKRKANMEEQVLKSLAGTEFDAVTVSVGGGGQLVRKTSTRTKPLQKEDILKAFAALAGDPARAQAALDDLYRGRETETREVITRTRPRA